MKPLFMVRTCRIVPPLGANDPFGEQAERLQHGRPQWVIQLDLVVDSASVLRWLLKWAATGGHELPPSDLPDSSRLNAGDQS